MTGPDRAPLQHRLADALVRAGATVVCGLPGGGPNLDVVGAVDAAGLRFVLAHGETAAAIMASTHGLLSGTVAVVVVTRGPGASSVANGLAQATLDRYPVVAVTDTVPALTAHRVAHQRLDQRAMLGPVSKVSATLGEDCGADVLDGLIGAARTWPFGAVHLDYDPSGTTATDDTTGTQPVAAANPPGGGVTHTLQTGFAAAQELLTRAERPVIIVGMEAAVTGVELSPAIEAFGCPVLTTYQAIGLVPTEGRHHAGLFTNGAIERPLLDEADLVLTVGLDLVEPIPQSWTYSCPVIRVSSMPQFDDYLPVTVDLRGDLVEVVDALGRAGDHWAWVDDYGARFRENGRERLRAAPAPEPSGFGPLEVVAELAGHADHLGTVTVDAGAHFLAVMPLWPVMEPLRLLISNGLATMGFALPAAIGAALARPGEPVLALTGDGGASMVLAELETIARLDLPITIVVFNDSLLSLIAIKQRPEHGGPDAVSYAPVDFAATARAAGVEGTVVHSAAELASALDPSSGLPSGWRSPRLIDARIDATPYAHLLAVTRG